MTEDFITEPAYVKVTVLDVKPDTDGREGTVAIEYTAGAGLPWAIAILRSVVTAYDKGA